MSSQRHDEAPDSNHALVTESDGRDFFNGLLDLDRFALGVGDVSKDQLIIRLNAFWSRLPLFLHGQEGRKFQSVPGAWDTMRHGIGVLEEISPLIEAFEPGDDAAYDRIRGELASLDRPLNKMIVDVLVHDEGKTIFRNDRLEGVYVQLVIAAVGTLLVGGVLIAMLLAEGRTSRRAQGDAQEARTQLRGGHCERLGGLRPA